MLLFYLSLIETQESRIKFEELYCEYKSLMKYIALDILNDDSLAEDAVHDAFIKIIKHIDGIKEIHSHKTKSFIVIVTKNICLDNFKKEKKHKHLQIDALDESLITQYTTFDSFSTNDIIEKIKLLPDTYRDILQLKVYYDYSDKQISDILNISHSAVRKRLQRARESLMKLLCQEGTDIVFK